MNFSNSRTVAHTGSTLLQTTHRQQLYRFAGLLSHVEAQEAAKWIQAIAYYPFIRSLPIGKERSKRFLSEGVVNAKFKLLEIAEAAILTRRDELAAQIASVLDQRSELSTS